MGGILEVYAAPKRWRGAQKAAGGPPLKSRPEGLLCNFPTGERLPAVNLSEQAGWLRHLAKNGAKTESDGRRPLQLVRAGRFAGPYHIIVVCRKGVSP